MLRIMDILRREDFGVFEGRIELVIDVLCEVYALFHETDPQKRTFYYVDILKKLDELRAMNYVTPDEYSTIRGYLERLYQVPPWPEIAKLSPEQAVEAINRAEEAYRGFRLQLKALIYREAVSALSMVAKE